MVAMTPIKEIWVIDTLIFALDYAGQLNPLASGPSPKETLIMAGALNEYHKRKAFVLSTDHRMMVPIEEVKR